MLNLYISVAGIINGVFYMKDIYLFRHGETDWNVQKKFQGRTMAIPLNSKGIVQAEAIAGFFSDKIIPVIYSSPARRAYQTAEIVSKVTSSQILMEEGLQERSFGLLEGLTFSEIIKLYPELEDQFKLTNNGDFVALDVNVEVETIQETQIRIHKTVCLIAEKSDADTIIISTHGAALFNLLISLGVGVSEHLKNGDILHLSFCPVGKELIFNEKINIAT